MQGLFRKASHLVTKIRDAVDKSITGQAAIVAVNLSIGSLSGGAVVKSAFFYLTHNAAVEPESLPVLAIAGVLSVTSIPLFVMSADKLVGNILERIDTRKYQTAQRKIQATANIFG